MGIRDWLSQGFGHAKRISGNIKTGVQQMPARTKVAAAAGAGLMGGLAARGFRKGKETVTGAGRDTGTMFLVLAFIIFVVDLMDAGGGRYTGFQWVWGFDNVSIITNIATSSIFGTFMLVYLINKVIRKEWDLIGYKTFSFVVFSFWMTFFIMNNQWFASLKAIIHFIYILVFGFTFIKSYEGSSTAYNYIWVLLLLDFFGYTLLKEIVIFRYIPSIFLITIFYVYGKTQNTASIFFFVLVLVILFIFAYKDVQAQGGDFTFITDKSGPTWEDWWSDFSQGIGSVANAWTGVLNKQIQYAITGKVEENQYKPIGVYLEDARPAETIFYEDEPIVVWGTIKAKTLDDPIKIQVGCYAGKEKKRADKVNPKEEFEVFSLEDQNFDCAFNKCENIEAPECPLKIGSNKITAFADFNFETLAYLKVYFMDNERKRAMTRDGLDIFEEFDIKDREPITVYTNGPVAIGMGTTTSLVGVSDSYSVYPTLTVLLRNRDDEGWQGHITRLNGLFLFLPEGVELESEDTCREIFNNAGEEECKKELCGETAESDCSEVCKYYNTYSLDTKKLREREDEVFESFRCKINPMSNKVLGNTPITTKYFRVKAKYDYILEKPVTVNIEEVPE